MFLNYGYCKSGIIIILILSIFTCYLFLSNPPGFSAEESEKLLEEARDLIVAGKIQEAIVKINQALLIDPSNPSAYFLLGNAYYGQKDYDSAIGNFKKAISYKEDYGEAFYNLGRAYIHKDNKPEGIKYLDKAKSIFAIQGLSHKYETCLELLIEQSTGDLLNSYKEELKNFRSYGLGPTPAPSFTPLPAATSTPSATSTPTLTPIPTVTPTITPTVTPRPTVIPDFSPLDGERVPYGKNYLSVGNIPYEGDVMYNPSEDKLYAPAEEFLKELGIKGDYNYYEGSFLVDRLWFCVDDETIGILVNEIPRDSLLLLKPLLNKKFSPPDFLTELLNLKFNSEEMGFIMNASINSDPLTLPDEFIRMDKYCRLYISVIDILEFFDFSYIVNAQVADIPTVIVKPTGIKYTPGVYMVIIEEEYKVPMIKLYPPFHRVTPQW